MTDEIKAQDAGASDKVKLAAAVLIVLAGVAGYYLLGAQAAWLRWLPVLGSLVLAALVIAWSHYGTEFWQFVMDARVELRKIVWPSREETGKTTLVVFVFVLVAGVFFWLLDLALAWATRAFTGQGG
ncbi:MAG: preprotein translocase subunit SecE [Gammaproteobacteria bacterium]|nr:MAG: preprotein translocase subunit SecE [Gammaproteobacteria bacterium]TLY81548.1 MAG: preprotein translocase subunit SecE [Gammaproteobacteria bacterium]